MIRVVVRAAVLAVGILALLALWRSEADADADARFQRASLVADGAAERAQAALQDLVSRFERVTGSLRAADLQGDSTALTIRLLRAEPLLTPATGLVVYGARGRPVAATAPLAADEDVAGPAVAAALGAETRVTLLSLGHGGNLLLARRIEEPGRGTVGLVTTTIGSEAVLALLGPARSQLGAVEVVVADGTGAEILRVPAEGDALNTPLDRLVPTHAAPSVRFGMAGLSWTGTVASEHADAGLWLSRAAWAAGAAFVMLLLAVWPARRPRPAAAAAIRPDPAIQSLQRQLDEAGVERNRVLAAIGHDVRTPINSILGISALLMDGNVDEGQRKWLQRIRASCDALLAMLNGMLEIAAASMDGAEVHREPVDVATLIEEIGEVLRPQAHDKGLELLVRIEPSVLGAWHSDPTRLRQVLFNLAGNAIKFTARGSVELHVTAPTPNRLCFEVTDTGPGIVEAERETVFEQFRRGRDVESLRQEGLGLGLALCREIAALLGGTLTLRSEVGAGSTFSFVIPADRVAADALGRAPLAGRTALVVGLSDGVRRRAASHLERMGFEVETAADGFLALGLAERTSFHHGCLDLILLDAVITGLPAEAVLARLQGGAHGERLRTIVVANGPVSDAIMTRADTIVPHPVEGGSIDRAVTKLFGSSSVLQELDPRMLPAVPLRVLVVEDNRINQLLFVDVLARAGFSAFAASSGEEAVEAAGRGGFDAILMDVQMPGIDGVEATLRIRAAEQPHRTPIIGLTAHTGAGVRKRCFDAGMDSVLHKPLDLSRLPLRLREAVAALRPMLPLVPGDASLDIADEYMTTLAAEVGLERARACIEEFLAQMAATLPQLEDYATSDLPMLGHLAHNLAGVAGTLGVTGLLDGLLQVEDAARQGDAVRVESALREVRQTWERVQPVLRQRFEGAAVRNPDVKRAA